MEPYDQHDKLQSDSQQRWGKVIFVICLIITILLAIYVSPLGFMLALWFGF